MPDTKFDSFVNFGSIVDKNKRAEIAASIYEQLLKKQNTSITLSNENTANFTTAIENILSNNTMRELCTKDTSLAEHITEDILDFINKTKRQMQRIEDPFENEQKLLDSFKQVDKNSFEKTWEITTPFIQETYEAQTFDTEFYHKEFQKSLSSNQKTKKNKNEKNKTSVSFQSVKEHFTDKWDGLIFQKRLKWELDIIEEQRKKFCEELYRQIEELKKLQELLEPFMGELGRLWDMSKGRWQKVNFDILKKYAELLAQDKSLQELAEMLGRIRQAEREYEEEIFTDIAIKPTWKVEHAGKSDLVGIHESDDISNMLPTEAALLSDPALETIFYKKFTEKKLQTFEYQAKILSYKEEEFQNKRQKAKENKKGPIIICVDTSGSMHGMPETIAKTLSFALLKMAVRDNRKCYLISFSTAIETLNLTDLKNNLEKLIEFLSMSFNGGTDATPAMQEALKMLETEDYKKADVIMVSDFVMPEFDSQTQKKIRSARENKTKFHSLIIGNSGNQQTIDEFDSNWVYNANDPKRVLNLVRNIRENM